MAYFSNGVIKFSGIFFFKETFLSFSEKRKMLLNNHFIAELYKLVIKNYSAVMSG